MKHNSSLNRDDRSQPDTNTNSISETHENIDGSQPSHQKPAVSEARMRANRENAKKSTGPKTARGKANSRFNAVTHGLLAKRVMHTPDGKLHDEGLQVLLESLREKYGRGDVRTELLVESIAIAYWRQGQGLAHEQTFLRNPDHFSSLGNLPNLQRYNTANQRALLKNLELLDKQLAESPVLESAAENESEVEETT